MNDPTGEPPRPDTIQAITGGVFPAFALLAALELELFTALADGPASAARIAGAVGGDAGRVERLLYLLAAAGLLEARDGGFANTAESAYYLVRGRPAYLGELRRIYRDVWPACLETAATIRAGAPQAEHDFATMSEDELHDFLGGLAPGAAASGRALARQLDLANATRIADVGGGSGALAIALCEAVPHLHAVVVELPAVAPVTRRFIDEAGAGPRVEAEGADLLARPLAGRFDVAVLRNLLQVLGPEDARRVLANVAAGVRPGGEVHVVGIGILDDSRLAPREALGLDLVFLNVYDHGRAYTEGEYRAWFDEAGLVEVQRLLLEGGYSMISARKPG